MRSKVRDETTRTIAVIYGSTKTVDETEMTAHVTLFADLLRRHAGATSVETRVIFRSVSP